MTDKVPAAGVLLYILHTLSIHAAALPPVGVNATQNGTTITVNWTPPDPTPSGYFIIYSSLENEGSVLISRGIATQAVIAGWQAYHEYTVSMVALSKHLPSVPILAPAVKQGM